MTIVDVGFLPCLSIFILLFFINSGSNAEAINQNIKYDNAEDQHSMSSSKATRMLLHDTYPITTTILHDGHPTTTIIHDTFPTNVPVNPMDDVPIVNPTPSIDQPPTPTFPQPTTPTTPQPTTPETGPPTIPTPSTGGGGGGGGGGIGGGGGGGGGSWCVANAGASEKALQVALDYACGYGGADCSGVQPGGSCYNPNTIHDHASYAFNDYYQKNPAPTSCVFGGTAQLTSTDPSNGGCHYPSGGGSASTPPATPTPTFQAPPDLMSPPSPMFPGNPTGGIGTMPGGSGLGAEPIGSPNTAAAISQQLFLIFSSTSILTYILLGNYL